MQYVHQNLYIYCIEMKKPDVPLSYFDFFRFGPTLDVFIDMQVHMKRYVGHEIKYCMVVDFRRQRASNIVKTFSANVSTHLCVLDQLKVFRALLTHFDEIQ